MALPLRMLCLEISRAQIFHHFWVKPNLLLALIGFADTTGSATGIVILGNTIQVRTSSDTNPEFRINTIMNESMWPVL